MSEEKSDQRTVVTFLLDRSDRMERIRQSTIKAFNTFVKTLKTSDRIELTLIQYNCEGLDQAYTCRPIGSVPRLTRKTYLPRAEAALIDSTSKAIAATAETLQRRSDSPKVVFCIQTSGERKPSNELRWDELKALIEDKSAQGWQFSFLACGLYTRKYAADMSIDVYRVLSYDDGSSDNIEKAFHLAAGNIAAYANGSAGDTRYGMHQYEDAMAVAPYVVISRDRPSVRLKDSELQPRTKK